jgi:hypothetical protein
MGQLYGPPLHIHTYSLPSYPFKVNFNSILPLPLSPQSGLFHSDIPTEFLSALSISAMCAICRMMRNYLMLQDDNFCMFLSFYFVNRRRDDHF